MAQKPNILWLITDHHVFANHYDYQPVYRGKLKTLERLYARGRQYTQAYSVCPLCTPARASLLTGQYPHHHGMILNPMEGEDLTQPEFKTRLDFDRMDELFGQCLQQQGYRVVQFGKWYGGKKTAADLGFEGWSQPWYGCPYSSVEYKEFLSQKGLPEPVVKVLWSADEPEAVGREFNLTRPMKYSFGPFHAARLLLAPKETHEAYFIADKACHWLDQYAALDNQSSFMLKVDVWGPHHPYDSAKPYCGAVDPAAIKMHPSFTEKYVNKPSNYIHAKQRWLGLDNTPWETMSRVLACAYEHAMLVDDALGTVLDKLEELGLDENTMVIYTADHGDLVAAHGNLFNKETLLVEETMKIPLAIAWPEHIRPGEKTDELVSNMDIPTTIMAAAGAVPDYRTDGIDMLADGKREQLMCQSFGCYKREESQRMLRWKNYKYIAHAEDIDELYDLEKDPFELDNLVFDQALAPVLTEMRRRLADEMLAHGDTADEAEKTIHFRA